MTRTFGCRWADSSSIPLGCRIMRRVANSRDCCASTLVRMSPYKSVPVKATSKGSSGYRRRKQSIAAKLRRACKATMRSYGAPSYACAMVTRWPRAFRMRAQRSAVTRFPCRDWAGTGVIRAIFMGSSYLTPPWRRCETRHRHHCGLGGRNCGRYCTPGASAWPRPHP